MQSFIINPRVLVFQQNERSYLFDPSSRSFAYLSNAMLDLIEGRINISSINSDEVRFEFFKLHDHMIKHKIIIESNTVNQNSIEPESEFKTVHLLQNLAIFVTTKCNLKCLYCYAYGGDTEKTITRELWIPAMAYYLNNHNSLSGNGKNQQPNVRLIIHGGGEPTVEFEVLRQIVSDFKTMATGKGLMPTITIGTNGTYGHHVQDWIIENKININISIDGPAEIHNKLRPFRSGENSYDTIINNITTLMKFGRRVGIRATVTNKTIGSMLNTVKMASNCNISSVHFEPVYITGRCSQTAISRPDADDFINAFLQSFILGLELNVDVRYSGLRCFDNPRKRFCGACGQNLCVTPDGNITTCFEVIQSEDPAAAKFFIGRINIQTNEVEIDQEKLIELWQRDIGKIMACSNCFMRYQCGGDCPLKCVRSSNGDLNEPDPYRCSITKGINKQLIVWLCDGLIKTRNIRGSEIISFT